MPGGETGDLNGGRPAGARRARTRMWMRRKEGDPPSARTHRARDATRDGNGHTQGRARPLETPRAQGAQRKQERETLAGRLRREIYRLLRGRVFSHLSTVFINGEVARASEQSPYARRDHARG